MKGRLGTLALVLVSNLVLLVGPALAGPPQAGPVEGPALPPEETSEPAPAPTIELPPPDIEFAPPTEHEFGEPSTSLPAPQTSSRRDEIGKAPNSGAAFVAGGLVLVPLAAYGTVVLVLNNRATEYPPHPSEPWIITAGVGLGVIGSSMLGVGIHRLVALSRWAKRRRVIALAQGSGLITSGTLIGLIGVGMLVSAIQSSEPVTGAIAGAMLVSAPIQIGVGIPFASRYARTGGWRPTRYTLTPGGLTMRF